MARYEQLPNYRDAWALAVHFEHVMMGFSRYLKYTLGTELRNASRNTVSLIIQTNNQSDKQPGLLAVRDHLEELLLLIRITKGFCPARFKNVFEATDCPSDDVFDYFVLR